MCRGGAGRGGRGLRERSEPYGWTIVGGAVLPIDGRRIKGVRLCGAGRGGAVTGRSVSGTEVGD